MAVVDHAHGTVTQFWFAERLYRRNRELAQRAGLEVTAGTFSTYLSDLRRNGPIEVGPTGEIAANEILIGN
ncbi:hypothetical protein [Gordonia sihwensis]|uniref:hypothetical protein n=1 Tax=Gordonia sihwensis TaxID=173559 RepID=UPI003D996B5D